MASLRTRTLKDGTQTLTVLFRAPDEHGVKRQTSETFDNPEAASRFMRDIDRHGPQIARKILDAHDDAAPATLDVVGLLDRHIGALSGIKGGTRKRYESIRRTIATHQLGALPITAVSRTDVAEWIGDLEKQGLSGKTIGGRHQLLSAAFKRAVLDDMLTKNPATGAKIPRTETRPKVFLTPEEFSRVYAVVPDPWRILVHTLAATGLRIGEALALRVGDLHLHDAHPRIDVRRTWEWTEGGPRKTGAPKTARGLRSVSIGPSLVAHLAEHTADLPPHAWVFGTQDDGEPTTATMFGQRWKKWVAASGIAKQPTVHSIRHSHVTWMLSSGRSLDQIQRRLGHASIKVTVDVYGHLMPDDLDTMAAASEAALAGSLSPVVAEIEP
ncbi:tyrosine-type recombinase/integrase [Isoptericola aurantiacus]|uniref:tyrosine-type recombinase/integrase n=1 Tax=Isoptericola aurantiacus TaxID=3377839 RepID=UPI00383BD4FF